ncbi:hypothetical protein DFH29DRAFT_1082464 [Suillus ampliporus]|nr:hypothetical protein DFH29DRAFT_1082464 [Suillus ampliporus]
MTSRSYTVETSGLSHQIVKRVDDEMKAKAGLLSLAEELQLYILSFLPCRDILRCTSACKALRQTYMSSSELQYIVELSGQRLLPVPNTDNRTPVYERLQLLRDKAHAWLKLDIDSFETFTVPEKFYHVDTSIAYGHLSVWDDDNDLVAVVPILPKPSQQTIERDWSPGTLCSVPNPTILDVFMDPTQNLIAIAYLVFDDTQNETLYIDPRALDSGSVHPRVAGRTLFPSGPLGYEDTFIQTKTAKLKVFGSHRLVMWDWQHSTKPCSTLSGTLPYRFYRPPDLCFLGNNRLLMVTTDNLRLYSIQDMSQPPQLLACFLMPAPIRGLRVLSMDDIAHISQQQIQAQQMMHISDPRHQILCLTASSDRVYVISTRIFFDLDGMPTVVPIPWKCWGPSNTRIFQYPHHCKVHVSGNRVLWAFPVRAPDTGTEHILHMMDFSPLAVTNRRGLGRVVKEPSTIDIPESTSRSGESFTTFLPYVEVVSDRRLSDLDGIWIDKDRIYLFKIIWDLETGLQAAKSSTLEVINILDV